MLFRVWMGLLQSHMLRLSATSLLNKIYLSVPFDSKDHVLKLKISNSDVTDLCEFMFSSNSVLRSDDYQRWWNRGEPVNSA